MKSGSNQTHLTLHPEIPGFPGILAEMMETAEIAEAETVVVNNHFMYGMVKTIFLPH
jgi:hypothetical protein